jgi:hypothetical protein
MSPLPPTLHFIAAAVGVWGALTLGAAVAPDLPTNEPGVIKPEAGRSILESGPFSIAMSQVEDQLGADEKIVALRVTPQRIDVTSSDSGDGVAFDDLSTSAPYLLAYRIGNQRPDVQSPEDFRLVTFHATPQGGIWTGYLLPRFHSPHVYRAAIPAGAVAFQVRVVAVPGS